MTDAEHECVFPEEREPSGRLILAPCLTCETSALDAMGQIKEELHELRRHGIPDDALAVARIDIIRYLPAAGGDIVMHEAVDSEGNGLPLVEALGMLRLVEDSIIREAMGEVPDDDDQVGD